jgi:hypothetical protein
MYDQATLRFGLYISKGTSLLPHGSAAAIRACAGTRATYVIANVLATHLRCVYPPCPSSVRRMKLNSSSSSTATPFFPLG